MNPQFETAEDIDREYGRRIEQERNPVRRSELQVEAARAKVQLELESKNKELIANWTELALYKFPEARKFPQLVTGATEQEILLSAEAAHKQVEELMRGTSGEQAAFDQARAAYGPAPVGGGSTGVPSAYTPPNMANERWNMQFAQRFNEAPRDAYGQRQGISPADVTRYTNQRFVDHVKNALNMWAMMTRSDAWARNRLPR